MNEETKLAFDKLAQTIREMANEGNKNNRILLGMDAAALLGDLVFALVTVTTPKSDT